MFVFHLRSLIHHGGIFSLSSSNFLNISFIFLVDDKLASVFWDTFFVLSHYRNTFKYKKSVSVVDCTDFVFFSGLTKRNRASRDNACDWTSQLLRSVGRALHRYRKSHEFKSRTGLNVFFRPSFHYCPSSVHYCEDLFHIHLQVLSLTDRLWLFYTLLRDRS